jgi:hypothetical protein
MWAESTQSKKTSMQLGWMQATATKKEHGCKKEEYSCMGPGHVIRVGARTRNNGLSLKPSGTKQHTQQGRQPAGMQKGVACSSHQVTKKKTSARHCTGALPAWLVMWGVARHWRAGVLHSKAARPRSIVKQRWRGKHATKCITHTRARRMHQPARGGHVGMRGACMVHQHICGLSNKERDTGQARKGGRETPEEREREREPCQDGDRAVQ